MNTRSRPGPGRYLAVAAALAGIASVSMPVAAYLVRAATSETDTFLPTYLLLMVGAGTTVGSAMLPRAHSGPVRALIGAASGLLVAIAALAIVLLATIAWLLATGAQPSI